MSTRRRISSSSSSTTCASVAASAKSSRRLRKPCDTSRKLWKKLDDFQRDAATWCLERNEGGLFFEQGTGKTWIAGAVIDQLLSPSFRALLIVPLTNIETTWAKFLADNVQAVICRSFEEYLVRGAIEGSRRVPTPLILLMHFEAVPALIKKLRKINWSLIVYDESQRLKDRNTIASRTAAKLRHSAVRKLILSGTPIEQQPQDLWAQFRFLAPSVFGERWKDFDEEFIEQLDIDLSKCRPGSFKFKKLMRRMLIMKRKRKFREDRMHDFLERIKPYALRVEAKDVLSLPELRILPTPVTLRGEQRRIYDQLERTGVVQLGRYRVTAPLKITQIWKLHQACGGYLLGDEGEVFEVGRAKMRKALSLIHREQKPIAVFCRYLEEIWGIAAELGDGGMRIETLTGKTPRKKSVTIKQEFQEGKIDVLICQVKSGGVGIDLFKSCVALVYSLGHSSIDYEQMIKRLHRRGQENSVSIFLLYARGTIDEEIYSAITSKRKVTHRVLTYLKRRRQHHGKDL